MRFQFQDSLEALKAEKFVGDDTDITLTDVVIDATALSSYYDKDVKANLTDSRSHTYTFTGKIKFEPDIEVSPDVVLAAYNAQHDAQETQINTKIILSLKAEAALRPFLFEQIVKRKIPLSPSAALEFTGELKLEARLEKLATVTFKKGMPFGEQFGFCIAFCPWKNSG